MNPLMQKKGDKEMAGKIRKIWEKREQALKEGDFQKQVLEGRIKDIEFLHTQRPKLALKMAKVFKGDHMIKVLLEETERNRSTPAV